MRNLIGLQGPDSAASGWPDVMQVPISGSLVAATGNAVLHRLLEAVVVGRMLAVDVSGVRDLDEAGVGVLCAVRSHARLAGGDLCLTGVTSSVRDVLVANGRTAPGGPMQELPTEATARPTALDDPLLNAVGAERSG